MVLDAGLQPLLDLVVLVDAVGLLHRLEVLQQRREVEPLVFSRTTAAAAAVSVARFPSTAPTTATAVAGLCDPV